MKEAMKDIRFSVFSVTPLPPPRNLRIKCIDTNNMPA